MWVIILLAKELLESEEKLCSKERVIFICMYVFIYLFTYLFIQFMLWLT